MSEEKNISDEQHGSNNPKSPEKSIEAEPSGSNEPTISHEKQAIQDSSSPEIEKQQTKSTKSSTSTSKPSTMEIHHHGHVHEKKKWKEYLFQFLMLFLAVFCGFLAEYQLEHVIEHQREKEFAKALYAELLDDSTVAANKMNSRLEKEKDMDYISNFFKDSSLIDLPKKFYPAYTTTLYLINTYTFEPKDGILSQLRNSGSLRYFKSIALQKLIGDISVHINNLRSRNEQEYQYFASPIKPFMLKYYDWSWIDNLRKEDVTANVLTVINNYRQSSRNIEGKILNISSLDRSEASNMVLFYKQMLVSTRTLQMNNYIETNHKILQVLRENYSLENE